MDHPVRGIVEPGAVFDDFVVGIFSPDESKTVTFRIKASDLAFMGTGKKWTLEAGEFNIACGDQSVSIHCTEDYTWEEENIPDN